MTVCNLDTKIDLAESIVARAASAQPLLLCATSVCTTVFFAPKQSIKLGSAANRKRGRVGIYTSFGPSIPVYTCIYTDTRIYGLNTYDD